MRIHEVDWGKLLYSIQIEGEFSLAGLARAMATDRSNLAKIRRNEREPTLAQFLLLAEVAKPLGLIEEFYCIVGDRKGNGTSEH